MIDLGWWATGVILAVAVAVFVWSRQVSLKAFDPDRPRLLNHGAVQLFALIVILLMLVHLITLFAGGPITGRR